MHGELHSFIADERAVRAIQIYLPFLMLTTSSHAT
jgi:hypothetical protein